MNIRPYIGDQYGLQFPVFCDAYIDVNYNNNTSSENIGIWNHTGSFSLQTLVTPYDINGYGSTPATTNSANINNDMGNQTVKHTMPSRAVRTSTTTQDISYMPVANRLNHRMAIFSSTNFKLYLINNTSTNVNQPAEYYLQAQITLDSTTNTINSNSIFIPTSSHVSAVVAETSYLFKNNQPYLIDTTKVVASSSASNRITVTFDGDSKTRFYVGQKLYREDGILLGIIDTITEVDTNSSGSVDSVRIQFTENMDVSGSYTIASSRLYMEIGREAKYIKGCNMLGYSYNADTASHSLFLNGERLATTSVNSPTTAFSFGEANITLGQDTTATTFRNSQFYGILHELAVLRGHTSNMSDRINLLPSYYSTLLYVDFEEADL
jgi:hypothetical protein